MKILVLILSLCIVQSIDAQRSGIQFEELSWEEVKVLAEEEDKLIFIDAYATWCIPCKQMDAQVFNRSDVGDFFNETFINYKMDLEKGIGPLLAARYSVQNYPAFLFLTPNETLVHKTSGYHNAPKLMTQAKQAAIPDKIVSAIDARYKEGDRKPDFLYDYTYRRYQMMDDSHHKIIDEYLQTQKDWTTPENLKYIFEFTEEFNSPLFPYLAKNRKTFYKSIKQEIVDQAIQIMVHTQIYNQSQPLDLETVKSIYGVAYPEELDWKFFQYQSKQYLATENYEDYAQALVEFWKKYPSKDPDMLYYEAGRFDEWFDDKIHKTKAIHFIQQALVLEINPKYYLKLADLYNQVGEKKLAKKTNKKYKKSLRKVG